MSGNKLLVCPYDEVHKVKANRMQLHITRCRLNHLNEHKFTCPFNATHVMPYQEKDYHLLHCADKAPLDRILAESLDKNNPFKGRTSVPSYSEAIPCKPNEIWDLEAGAYEPTPGYLPSKERPSGAVIEPIPFLGASVKRQLYQELHQKSESIDFKLNLNSGSSIPAPIPRQPKQPSEASKFESMRMEDFPCLGRGRGKIPLSRIAANFYSLSVANKGTMSPNRYSSVVSPKMNNDSNANDNQMNTSFMTDNCDFSDVFRPLGLGRGKFRNDTWDCRP